MNWFTTLLINSLKHHGGLPKKIPVTLLNSFTHAETGDCLFGSPSYLPVLDGFIDGYATLLSHIF